jgi:hypothetical protein
MFDLATAADRDGKCNPAFASMLSLIDAAPLALDQAKQSTTVVARTPEHFAENSVAVR